jgi:hypothetical protein
VSFALTHFGGELASGEDDRILTSVLALGLVTGAPILIGFLRRRRGKARDPRRKTKPRRT